MRAITKGCRRTVVDAGTSRIGSLLRGAVGASNAKASMQRLVDEGVARSCNTGNSRSVQKVASPVRTT